MEKSAEMSHQHRASIITACSSETHRDAMTVVHYPGTITMSAAIGKNVPVATINLSAATVSRLNLNPQFCMLNHRK